MAKWMAKKWLVWKEKFGAVLLLKAQKITPPPLLINPTITFVPFLCICHNVKCLYIYYFYL